MNDVAFVGDCSTALNAGCGWWCPENSNGPDFGYPAALFDPKTYELEPTIEPVSALATAVGLTHKLDEDVWKRLVIEAMGSSKVLTILQETDHRTTAEVLDLARSLKPVFEQRWWDLY